METIVQGGARGACVEGACLVASSLGLLRQWSSKLILLRFKLNILYNLLKESEVKWFCGCCPTHTHTHPDGGAAWPLNWTPVCTGRQSMELLLRLPLGLPGWSWKLQTWHQIKHRNQRRRQRRLLHPRPHPRRRRRRRSTENSACKKLNK